ncbi:YecH family metal-binding protein [Reinekea thalattae]|uniref:DUF2492 family protein n=1 Tax=Reinekea thalattae TaxID=2593301 RepID=A0A5C8ZCC3_9GAMM|nr:YecH family metal-binding protein [Reinekea thalattae]TXR54566.1 DUF2492 family protein [Reinekea thalattae]
MQSIHGHDVMQMMINSNQSYSKASLIEKINQQFGEQCRFHTCSAEDMDAAQLVDFLAQQGKFFEQADGFRTDDSKMCNHE